MATSISIGTSLNSEVFRSRLGKELSFLKNEGISVSFQESSLGEYTILDCSVKETTKPEQEMILRHYVANAISDFILNVCENLLLQKITKSQYYYLTKDEKENVLNKARNILELVSKPGEDNFLLYRLNRKSKILHKLVDYLAQNSDINIDGFIKFRLQDYIDDLNHVLEQAVDELMLEKEYQEFILLLKYFVDLQDPKVAKIHVLLFPGGAFQLFDDHNESIHNQSLEGCMVDMIEDEINYEDLLISALITIAPREIVLHVPEPAQVFNTVKTLQGVFDERLVVCNGCARCNRKNRNSH